MGQLTPTALREQIELLTARVFALEAEVKAQGENLTSFAALAGNTALNVLTPKERENNAD